MRLLVVLALLVAAFTFGVSNADAAGGGLIGTPTVVPDDPGDGDVLGPCGPWNDGEIKISVGYTWQCMWDPMTGRFLWVIIGPAHCSSPTAAPKESGV